MSARRLLDVCYALCIFHICTMFARSCQRGISEQTGSSVQSVSVALYMPLVPTKEVGWWRVVAVRSTKLIYTEPR